MFSEVKGDLNAVSGFFWVFTWIDAYVLVFCVADLHRRAFCHFVISHDGASAKIPTPACPHTRTPSTIFWR